ncbi:MAG: hypothetical protein JWP82_2451 [Humibacillus sp.]|nr:hypothetical protein [Humibacillus sp.]
MLPIALVMLVIVVLAVLVVTYVAFPHRGQEVPAAPWLGDAMARAAEAAPTLPTEGDEVHVHEVSQRQEAQHRA